MGKYIIDESTLTDIANSIRTKTGSTDSISVSEMASTLDSISNRSDSDVSIFGGLVNVPAGNYIATVSMQVDSVTADIPAIELTSEGMVRATTHQLEGYVYESDTEATEQLPVAEGAVITPSTEEQVAIMSGTYAIGDITVEGDSNLVPGNIVQGVSIFGVEGTYDPRESSVELPPISVDIFNTYFDTDPVSAIFIAPNGTLQNAYISDNMPHPYTCSQNSILILYIPIHGSSMCGLVGGEEYLLYHVAATNMYPVDMFVFRITESCSIEIEESSQLAGEH